MIPAMMNPIPANSFSRPWTAARNSLVPWSALLDAPDIAGWAVVRDVCGAAGLPDADFDGADFAAADLVAPAFGVVPPAAARVPRAGTDPRRVGGGSFFVRLLG